MATNSQEFIEETPIKMYLAVDQFNNKTILENIKYKTLKSVFYCGSIKKMYVDTKRGEVAQVGFVLGQGRGNQSLWVKIFKLSTMKGE